MDAADRLSILCVESTATIRETMRAIDAGAVELALVVGADGTLIGTVTDGDVRALLSGASLHDTVEPFANRGFRSVSLGTGRAEVLDLMQSCSISQVPVVDDEGRVIALHVLRELIGRTALDISAVVMAGGQGSRLRPVTEKLPKPMIRVAGRPILERIVLHLVGHGVRTIFLAVNYMAEVIESHFGDGDAFGCSIQYLREAPEAPLGTAGALTLLPRAELDRGRPLLVMNGDLLTEFEVGSLLRDHEHAEASVTVGVRPYAHQIPFGVIEQDGGDIVAVTEKPTVTSLVNGGVYMIQPDILRDLPRDTPTAMTDVVNAAIKDGRRVTIFPLDGDWADIGEPAQLRQARGEVL